MSKFSAAWPVGPAYATAKDQDNVIVSLNKLKEMPHLSDKFIWLAQFKEPIAKSHFRVANPVNSYLLTERKDGVVIIDKVRHENVLKHWDVSYVNIYNYSRSGALLNINNRLCFVREIVEDGKTKYFIAVRTRYGFFRIYSVTETVTEILAGVNDALLAMKAVEWHLYRLCNDKVFIQIFAEMEDL